MAERSQLSRLSTTQLSDGDKLMERISEERAHALRLKDKVKTVRKESLEQLQQLQFEMGDQARSHEIRVSEYERQLAYLRSRLNEKQQEAEQARVDTKRISQELDIMSRAATAENQKLKEQLQFIPERDSGSSNGH
ncbi:uncharacterized protein LOC119106960 [Pollicipes pollicipes]|uniref:uncharacterized protein LOC119106960 n=1 Tax=Pollicipes pollicipes TaxID=41117 RepID=UPI0018854C1B|nr:uncharacterized protein LOC119106960 [Pollicipes pollicipes]